MIPNITAGSDPVGLATYLVGEGRSNEHENPHLVAGSPLVTAWFDDRELGHDDAVELGREIGQAQRLFDVDVRDGHIRHISLSLHKDDGELTDDQWAEITTDFMRRMEYIDVEGKADARWAAVRHGLSGQTQNDHVHIMVSAVRDDGTKVQTWRDMPRSQNVARDLEEKHGLFKVGRVMSARGYSPHEVQAAKARGRAEPERDTLARAVRACSVAAHTEDEFVRRLRGEGLRVRASYTEDGEVRGYMVALRPPEGQRAIYYGGGKLARDLGLGTLRRGWEDTPEAREAAAKEWDAATRGVRVVAPGREQSDPGFSAGQLCTELREWRERLASLAPDDHAGWRATAAELSGVFAAWSRATEPEPGPLADVATELGRSAQMRREPSRAQGRSVASGARAAMMLTYLAAQDDPRAVLAIGRQVTALAGALHKHAKESENAVRENGLERVARQRLIALNEQLHARAGVSSEPARPAGPAPRGPSVMPQKFVKTVLSVRANAPAEKGL